MTTIPHPDAHAWADVGLSASADPDAPGADRARATHEISPALRSWRTMWGSLWARREIVFYLTMRDIRVRFHQTVLGSLWALVQPLATTLVFAVVFGRLVKIQSGAVPYPIFVLTGVLPWQFMASAIQRSGASLVANGSILKKVYFPRLAIPLATLSTAVLEFTIGCVVLVLLMLNYNVSLSINLLLLPGMMALSAALVLGIGLLLASLNCRFRDVSQGIGFALQMWMFLTPIVYPFTKVPERFQDYMRLNPMTGLIGGFRSVFLGRPCDSVALLISVVWAALFLTLGGALFRRAERRAADWL